MSGQDSETEAGAALKAQGDEAFKDRNYSTAHQLYSEAITSLSDVDPSQESRKLLAVLHSNRSGMFLEGSRTIVCNLAHIV